jgi:hypothetical protein
LLEQGGFADQEGEGKCKLRDVANSSSSKCDKKNVELEHVWGILVVVDNIFGFLQVF